jgi:hypothetical protein
MQAASLPHDLLKDERQVLHPVTHDECGHYTCAGRRCGSAFGPGRPTPGWSSGPARQPETKEPGSRRNHPQSNGPCEARAERNPRVVQADTGIPPRLGDAQFDRVDRSQTGRSHHGVGDPAGGSPATCRRVAENSSARLMPTQA